ncbi:MAG: nitrate reductase molybdenum cofactor assembly chaperone [Desulfobacterales bacterium]
MNAIPAQSLKVLAALLYYPDEELLTHLDEISAIAKTLQPRALGAAVQAFARDLKRRDLLSVQEQYTALFDMNPETTLNMTYHAQGDTEARAAELARLRRSYTAAGWEPISGELPDYLPLMLEFAAVCPQRELTEPVWRTLESLAPLVERLKLAAPHYAALLQPLRPVANGCNPAGQISDTPPDPHAYPEEELPWTWPIRLFSRSFPICA